MTVEATGARQPSPATTLERPSWWIEPVAVAVGFTIFVIYSFWSVAFGTSHYHIEPYLSPFYSPLLKAAWWPLSSAFLVAWVPLGFRATCYYYRKAYYRAFFWDPPACAIREPSIRHRYTGEQRFPWILNNLHRFFLYLVIIVLIALWWDTVSAFHTSKGFYLGWGSVFMLANVVLISLYTFSCHALRHFVGGSVNCFTCARAGTARRGVWRVASRINPYHASFAWASLISVGAVDIYIRLVANGAFGHCIGAHYGC